jgi:iron complex outermembrane receptor protein
MVANTLTLALGAADLVAVTGYQHAKRNAQEDSDNNPLPILAGSYVAHQETVSQELRVQSTGAPRLSYILGV